MIATTRAALALTNVLRWSAASATDKAWLSQGRAVVDALVDSQGTRRVSRVWFEPESVEGFSPGKSVSVRQLKSLHIALDGFLRSLRSTRQRITAADVPVTCAIRLSVARSPWGDVHATWVVRRWRHAFWVTLVLLLEQFQIDVCPVCTRRYIARERGPLAPRGRPRKACSLKCSKEAARRASYLKHRTKWVEWQKQYRLDSAKAKKTVARTKGGRNR